MKETRIGGMGKIARALDIEKACELTELDSHAVQEKRASKGNTTDDGQLIVYEGEEQADDIGR